MTAAVVAAVSSVLAVAITVIGSLLTSRNDRALTHQEVDLLAKLPPNSEAAKKLQGVIDARIERWYERAYKIKNKHGRSPSVTVRRSWFWPWLGTLILFVVFFIVLFFVGPLAQLLHDVSLAIIRNITS